METSPIRLERLQAGPSTTLRASVGSVVTRVDKAATTVVHEVWNPGTGFEMTSDVTVELQMMDMQWKSLQDRLQVGCRSSDARHCDRLREDV